MVHLKCSCYRRYDALSLCLSDGSDGRCTFRRLFADRSVRATLIYPAAPQHFLYFLPLPQGHGSLRPTFSPERTTCATCMSPEPAMRACSSSRFFLRWKASSISSTEVAIWRGGRPFPRWPPVITEGTPVSACSDEPSGPRGGNVPESGGRSRICIR